MFKAAFGYPILAVAVLLIAIGGFAAAVLTFPGAALFSLAQFLLGDERLKQLRLGGWND
mgnify:CR=1